MIAFGFPSVNWAGETKTELVLFRDSTTPWSLFPGGRACTEVFYLEKGQNLSDFRDMRNFFCEGEYSLTLDGPPGTTVTLYGQFFFGEDRGTLTLTKTDDRQVWMLDLEDFPDRKWVAADANNSTGAYEVFYQAAPNFKMNLGSLKWAENP
ncbi:MAG: hypothetical protein H8E42_06620 [Nitrospinae bacterium]|nr:hypothetical protein [Nitrospinota bacterium]MBL7019760.1 hypothetical protein [Nitrospinaceae bacterium]